MRDRLLTGESPVLDLADVWDPSLDSERDTDRDKPPYNKDKKNVSTDFVKLVKQICGRHCFLEGVFCWKTMFTFSFFCRFVTEQW